MILELLYMIKFSQLLSKVSMSLAPVNVKSLRLTQAFVLQPHSFTIAGLI